MSRRNGLLWAGVLLVVVVTVVGWLFPSEHGPGWRSYWYSHLPGFYAVLGLLSCWGLAFVSKALGALWLTRKENPYGE